VPALRIVHTPGAYSTDALALLHRHVRLQPHHQCCIVLKAGTHPGFWRCPCLCSRHKSLAGGTLLEKESKLGWEDVCVQDPVFRNFTRLLLKVPEHIWGIDSKVAPATFDVWQNADFRAALGSNKLFAIAEESWLRQSAYIPWSIQVCAAGQSLLSVKSHLQHAVLTSQ
jgi:hypothetical protein